MSLHEPRVRGLKRRRGSVTLKVVKVKVYRRGRSTEEEEEEEEEAAHHRDKDSFNTEIGFWQWHEELNFYWQKLFYLPSFLHWRVKKHSSFTKKEKHLSTNYRIKAPVGIFFFFNLLMKQNEFNIDASVWHYRRSQRLSVRWFIIYFFVCNIQKCWLGVGVSLKHPFFIRPMAENQWFVLVLR